MNQRKRIISMALMLIILFSVMAMSVYASVRYSTATLYYYQGNAYSSALAGDSADGTCANWAASTGNAIMQVQGYRNGVWYGLGTASVAPGVEKTLPDVSGDGMTQYRLFLVASTDTTRADGVIAVYSD